MPLLMTPFRVEMGCVQSIAEGEQAAGTGLPQESKEVYKGKKKNLELPGDKSKILGRQSETNFDSEVPKMSIAMLVCGTRGDVQPFIALGIQLQAIHPPPPPLTTCFHLGKRTSHFFTLI